MQLRFKSLTTSMRLSLATAIASCLFCYHAMNSRALGDQQDATTSDDTSQHHENASIRVSKQEETQETQVGKPKAKGKSSSDDKTDDPDRKPEDIEQVRQRLNGDWTLVAGVNQGRKLSPKELTGSHVIINDNTIVVLDPQEKELYKATFELEVATDDKPHRLNMSSVVPDAPSAISFGILQFTKQGWKLAYSLPGAERPQEFASPMGSKIMLFESVAVKKEEPLIPGDDGLPHSNK